MPGSVVEAERAIERAREEAEYDAYMAAKARGASGSGEGAPAAVKKEEDEQVERSIFADAEDKLREAEKALYRKAGKKKAGTPFTVGESDGVVAARIKEEDKAAKEDGSLVREAGAADVNVSGKTAEAGVPVTEAALDDGFNAEMADAIAQDAAEGAFQEQQAEAKKEEGAEEDEEEWYEEQRAVEWKDLSLETKVRTGPFLWNCQQSRRRSSARSSTRSTTSASGTWSTRLSSSASTCSGMARRPG